MQLHSIVAVAQSAVVKAHGVILAVGVWCLFTYPYFFVEEGLSIGNSEKFVYNGVDVRVFGVVARQEIWGL